DTLGLWHDKAASRPKIGFLGVGLRHRIIQIPRIVAWIELVFWRAHMLTQGANWVLKKIWCTRPLGMRLTTGEEFECINQHKLPLALPGPGSAGCDVGTWRECGDEYRSLSGGGRP